MLRPRKNAVFAVIQVTSRGRIARLMNSRSSLWMQRVSRPCRDCLVEHKVTLEESGQARGGGVGQPVRCEDKLISRRTLRA